MGKEIKVRIIMRYNSTEGWAALNSGDSVLAKGEIGLEYISGSPLPKMKIGTGELSWDNLPYFETSLPKNFTWGNLRGTTLQTSSTITENLELTKPGFLDTVNIVTLNKNFDKIDIENKFHSDKINELGERLSLLISNYFPSYPDYDPGNTEEVPFEIKDARIRFKDTEQEETKNLIGDVIRAIDSDLQIYKTKVDEIIQDLIIPTSLEINEEGKIYLIDKKGSQIGNAITVKDSALETKVGVIETNTQILDLKIKDNMMEIGDLKNTISKLPSTFPNNLIYEDNKLYLAVDDEIIENSMVEITGGGGASDTTYKVKLTTPTNSISKPLGDTVIITFNYSSYDEEAPDSNDGPGSGELLIDGIQRLTFQVPQGENTLDITKYLAAGSNIVDIKVTNTEGTSRKVQIKVKLLTLTISSSFDKLSYHLSELMGISFTVNSEREVEYDVYFMLTKQNARPGEPYYERTQIFKDSYTWGVTTTAYINPLPSGAYTLEIYAVAGETFSNIIKLGLIIYTESDINPYIVMLPDKITYSQGEIVSIPYSLFHPNDTSPNITFTIYSYNSETGEKTQYYQEVIRDIERSPQELTVQRYPIGQVIFELTCENVSNSVQITIDKSQIELDLFTDGLLFEFDPIGRTNQNSANHWSYIGEDKKEIIASFSNIDWGILDGWQIKKDSNGNNIEDQTMLRILPGGKMTIPFYPFKDEIANNNVGYTIEIEVATQNVTNYDSLILASFDDSEGSNRGLRVYSQSAELKSQNNTISAQFKEDERVRLTFTIEPATLNKLIMIYINGVLCGVKKYEQDAFRHTKDCPIIIGAEDSGIDIYFIRAYKRVLNETQQLNNFCVDRPSFGEKVSAVTRNDILNASAGADLSKIITINSLKGSIPYIIMHCPKLPANKDQDKFKGMKMTFVDPSNPARSFTAEGCTFSVQGTSSAGYPVKNFKIKLDKEKGIKYTRNGQIDLDGFYFEGKEKSQPTKVFCLKADYASSESANNVMLVDYYNETCPYRNEAQQYQIDNGMPETVRHGIYGEPIVLFWQNTNTNEVYFQGKYNFNDDKDSEEVFGYVGVLPENKYNIECWEFTNNNMPLCLFKHNLTEGDNAWFREVPNDKGEMVPAWSNSFERRFPAQEDDIAPDLTAFRRMVDWVASTNTIDVFNTPLSTPVYYRTLDKGYVEGKPYYQKNTTGSFVPFDIVAEDTTFSYSSNVRINNTIMVPKIQLLLQTEVRPIDLIFAKKEDSTWRLYYVEENNEVELDNNIADLSTYGIAFDISADSDIGAIENFSIQFYKGNNWTSQLYEYHTHDTSSYRLAKFKNEFEDYFILDAMAYYYVFTETVLLMDNRAKNMFLVSYDVDLKPVKVGDEIIYEKQPAGTYGHWAPTPYDMDSALGINNEGELVYGYHLEDDGRDGKVFTGQDSVLWNNFRDCFQTEIANMYVQLRSQAGTTNGDMPFSYETLSAKMNKHQDAWPEIVWNIDQQIKYLQPFYNGIDHLAMAQGDKRAQRNFWMYNAFKYRDSKYSAGDALEENAILFRLNGPGEFNIIPYSNIYARVKFGNAKDIKKRVFRNETATFSTEGIASIFDLETYIYSADRISSIGDLSSFNIGLCNFAKATKLKEIILGSEEPGYQNTRLKNFRAGASSVLKEVNLSNCVNLKMEINLEECPVLETFKAKGSGITGAIFAKGARLRTCYLPVSVSTLSLRDLSYLEEEGLQIETKENGKYAFSGIRIENCPQIPFYDLIMNSDNLRALRLTDLEWHTVLNSNSGEQNFTSFYNKVKKLISIDENGFEVPDKAPHITGKIYFEEAISLSLLEEINTLFPELIIVVNSKPQYFLTFIDYNNEVICKYIADEGDIPLDPTIDKIPGLDKTPAQVLNWLNTKPSIDRVKNNEDPEGEIDVNFYFERWSNMPQKVTGRAVISPKYKEEYLVKFFDEQNKLIENLTTWVFQNENVSDPIVLTKQPTAKLNFTHTGWNKSLLNIQEPTNFFPVFDEKINIYTVEFYSTLNEPLSIQEIEYGAIAKDISQTQEIKFYIGGDINKPSNLHEFKVWETKVSGIQGLTITPDFYQNEPIRFDATFTFTGNINDISWTQIAESAKNGTTNDYSVGSTKDIYIAKDGVDYIVTMELVAINFDRLSKEIEGYNGNTNLAAYTFLTKEIKWLEQMNKDTKTFIHPETGIEFSGPTAGGWSTSDLRAWSNNEQEGLFALLNREENKGLTEAIKEVDKISDIGSTNYPMPEWFYYALNSTNDKIWIPSTTELGTYYEESPLSDEQSSQYYEYEGIKTYRPYEWFSNNQSRLKTFNSEYMDYFTRTSSQGHSHRFLKISNTGVAFHEVATASLGYVFGFCI